MKNKLREKMLSGEKTIGSFFELGSGTAMECLALSGLDYVIINSSVLCLLHSPNLTSIHDYWKNHHLD